MRIQNERLVYTRHTKRWEIAHVEIICDTKMWVRQDYSTICEVGKELAIEPLPRRPIKAV